MKRNEFTIEERLSQLEQLRLFNKNVFNLDDLAKYTGLSKSYLYKLTSLGKIPHFKPQGKLLFFDKEQIDMWLCNNPVKTKEEIEMETTNHVVLNRKNKQC
jgi:excisionase family DNA binding protein